MILCCGEALIDMLPRELVSGEKGFMPVAGGAIFNTALALGRLGEITGFFSCISQDQFGNQLVGELESSNVQTDLCLRSEKPSTLAFVEMVNDQAVYSFFDENSAGRNLEVSQLPILPPAISTLHFGAISLVQEPCGSAFESLMFANQDRILSLDPNIRTSFIKDEVAHRDRITRMITIADIVKVSDEDLDWIANGNSHESTIASWLENAPQIILLTKGADGVNAYTNSGMIFEPVVKAKTVDTIGAGDAFNAGFLTGLKRSGLLTKANLKNLEVTHLSDAAKLAAKVAARTVEKAGANSPWQSEL